MARPAALSRRTGAAILGETQRTLASGGTGRAGTGDRPHVLPALLRRVARSPGTDCLAQGLCLGSVDLRVWVARRNHPRILSDHRPATGDGLHTITPASGGQTWTMALGDSGCRLRHFVD